VSDRDNGAIEQQRLALQASLDAGRSQATRNRLGQFATPTALADDIMCFADSLIPEDTDVDFLDPAFGTGSFYAALIRRFPGHRIASALGYEIDPYYGNAARALWADTSLRLLLEDFTRARPPGEQPDRATLLVCNPPYVRHHHLPTNEKRRLRAAAVASSGTDLNGLAGLYCYFMLLAHRWMTPDGLAIWLVPSEFMDVKYGLPLKDYLLNRVALLRIHRFDPRDAQFDDADVSSAVVCFRNSDPAPGQKVEFTYGGSLEKPRVRRLLDRRALDPKTKWTRAVFGLQLGRGGPSEFVLSDLFVVKRGIATGANSFFLLGDARAKELGLPREFLRPILPSPRLLRTDEVCADANGDPLIEPRLLLLDCRLPEADVRDRYPGLWEYLQTGVAAGLNCRYLCGSRSPWYAQEERAPAPFLCTYMGRSSGKTGAFRFILNRSCAVATNVYLMLYPRAGLARMLQDDPMLTRRVYSALQDIPGDDLIGAGRVYGGGLHKLEPKELSAVTLDRVAAMLPELRLALSRQYALY